VHREFWRGRLWAARPLTVVDDREDGLLLWIPQGTLRKVPVTPPTRSDPPSLDDRIIENLARCDWDHGDHAWDVSSLWIVRPGDWHAVWVSWLAGAHYGWYVNFQMPYRRTERTIDAMDLMLDIVAEPDLSWRWKDREQFNEILKRGVFDEEIGTRVRDEAEAVIERIERRDPPFCESWPMWRPDPSWPRPVLPGDWAEFPDT